MIKFSTFFTLWMGILGLAFAYQQADLTNYAWAAVSIGTLWTWGLLQFKKQIPRFGIVLLSLLSVIALFNEIPFAWAFAGALGALLSYDLSNFRQRLRYISPTEDIKLLQRVHLTRLSIITLLGLALSTITIFWQAEFTFEWGVFLMLAGVWGVSLLVGWVRRSE